MEELTERIFFDINGEYNGVNKISYKLTIYDDYQTVFRWGDAINYDFNTRPDGGSVGIVNISYDPINWMRIEIYKLNSDRTEIVFIFSAYNENSTYMYDLVINNRYGRFGKQFTLYDFEMA